MGFLKTVVSVLFAVATVANALTIPENQSRQVDTASNHLEEKPTFWVTLRACWPQYMSHLERDGNMAKHCIG